MARENQMTPGLASSCEAAGIVPQSHLSSGSMDLARG